MQPSAVAQKKSHEKEGCQKMHQFSEGHTNSTAEQLLLHCFLKMPKCFIFFSNVENQPEMISKEFNFAISISISSRKIHAYMMHIQKLVFHCISCFANCWLTQLYEGRRSSWRCLSKLRWNWNTNAMHCKKRTLTSSGKCAVLHSQFRLIGDQLSDLKIGAWKLHDKICGYLTLFEFLHKI